MAFGTLDGDDDEVMSEINMTPLDDVMLVLLIIFIITIPVINHAVKIDLPRATNQPNDTKPQNWAHKDAFAADYRDLVRQFQDLPSHPRVYACRPCAVFGDGAFGINAPALAEELPILDAVAADLRLPVIDIFEATKNRPDVFPDRVHPNNAGAVILAETVYRAIMGTADAESRGARSRG